MITLLFSRIGLDRVHFSAQIQADKVLRCFIHFLLVVALDSRNS